MSVEKININNNNNFDYLKKFRIKNNVLDSDVSLLNHTIDKSIKDNKTINNIEETETESSQEYIIKNNISNLPIGTIILYSIKKIPDGFLKCNGRKYNISLYRELYNIIGNEDIKDKDKFIIPKLLSPNKDYIYIIKY